MNAYNTKKDKIEGIDIYEAKRDVFGLSTWRRLALDICLYIRKDNMTFVKNKENIVKAPVAEDVEVEAGQESKGIA